MGRPWRPGAGWSVAGDERPGWDRATAGTAGEPAPPARRPRLEPVPDPPGPGRRRARDRRAGANALDELLPGPRAAPGSTSSSPGLRPRRAGGSGWPRGHGAPGGTSGSGTRSTAPHRRPRPGPGPAPVPAKVRVSFRLPADLVETARDAVAHLAGTADRTNLTALTERALRVELARLAITHNHGQPFTPRDS